MICLFHCLTVFTQGTRQNIAVCKDSNTITRYHAGETFDLSSSLSLADGGTISWGGMPASGLVRGSFYYLSIYRTDRTGAIKWATKLLPEENLNFVDDVNITQMNNGGFIVTGMTRVNDGSDYTNFYFIACISDNGVLQWHHFYQGQLKTSMKNTAPYRMSKPGVDAQDNIYLSVEYVDTVTVRDSVPSVISKYSANGALVWSKGFVFFKSEPPVFSLGSVFCSIFVANDTLSLFDVLNYKVMQMKSSDASLIAVKAFEPVGYVPFSDPPEGQEIERTANNRYVFSGNNGAGDNAGIDFSTVIFNQNLEPIKAFQVKTFSPGYLNALDPPIKNYAVTPAGEIVYGITRNYKYLLLLSLDTNYQVSLQKKVQYANPANGSFSVFPLTGFRNNKLLVRSTGCGTPTSTSICDIDNLSFNKNLNLQSNCFSVRDTSFAELFPFKMLPVAVKVSYEESDLLREASFINLTQQNTIFTATEVCKEISICETPAISGKDSICLASNENIFTVHVGIQCLEKVKWRTDTSAISDFKMIDDTTISISFKKNWRGYVYASLSGACGDMSDSFFVTAYKNISRKILSSDTSICAGDTAFIKAEAGFVSYKWNNGATTSSIAVTTKANYSVQAFTNDGCYVADTLQILTVFTKPKVEFGVNDFICKGSNEVLDAGDGFINYLWQNGSTERYFTVTMPGQYWVGVKDANGCKGGDTAVITKIYNAPANFLFNDSAICPYETIELKPSTSYLSYLWSNGTVAPSLTINNAGVYWLKVIDNNGCVGIDSTLVTEKFCVNRIIFSNAFSPDKNGINDIFKPFVTGSLLKYKLDIFNRWGKKVFESDDPKKGWDGNGSLQTSTGFVWICNYQFAGEQPKSQKGSLLLVR